MSFEVIIVNICMFVKLHEQEEGRRGEEKEKEVHYTLRQWPGEFREPMRLTI